MYKGGYQIIDISGMNFDLNKAERFKGVYEKVSGTTKPIMISDFTVAGKHERAAFVQAYRSTANSDYIMEIDNGLTRYMIYIQKNDMVRINEVNN